MYRIFDSAWTQRTDGVSSRPDDGSVQADSRRTAFALQAENKAGSRNPDPTATDQCASPAGTATTVPQQHRSFSVCLALSLVLVTATQTGLSVNGPGTSNGMIGDALVST